jgi:superfamily II DNA or RNA helicase
VRAFEAAFPLSSLPSLLASLSPTGTVRVTPADDAPALSPVVASRITRAFEAGSGAGLLHLGAMEVSTHLPASLAFFRDVARLYVEALCRSPELDAASIEAPADELASLASAAPPMLGAEYVTPDLLASLWTSVAEALRDELAASGATAAAWLKTKDPAWNIVGRVCFHLAENKGDEETPFAFLATYATRVSDAKTVKHRPLGKALDEYAGARDKKGLLALLAPVQRAAGKSALVRALVDSGDIYHPLAWSAREAYAFFKEIPSLEQSGVVVRVPNWWSARNPPRPEVRVTVGGKPPSLLGTDAVLDFKVDLALDGESLTADERRRILESTNGLVLVKGKWVEIDSDKLRDVLAHWKLAESAAKNDGVTFRDAMRWLAGAPRDGAAAGEDLASAGWSRVEAGAWMAEALDGLRSPEGLAECAPGKELHATLRPYQEVGVRWLRWIHELGLGACLADDMGLGKTIQVLSLLLLLAKKRKASGRPALLVVPASLLGNWSAEADRFAPSLRLLVAHPSTWKEGDVASIPAARVDAVDAVVTTYGALLRAPWIAERDWELVVLDEAQAIKNPGAKQTRAVKKLKARARLALTGTPIENRLGDLWSLFDFLLPGLLGSAAEFGRVSKTLAKREHNAYAPLRALVRPYVLRRLKSDKSVISDLPDKTEVRAFCALTKAQATLYEAAVRDLRTKIHAAEGIERRGAILAALMRFKQICNHPSQWLGDGAYAAADSGKLTRLTELCEPIAERQEKVLVFTQFREMTEPLARHVEGIFGRKGLVLHGGTPVAERRSLVDEFQRDDGPPFFVLSVKAGGTGLNLTAASHVIHFDRWWNPAVEDQATDRAYRIGQKRNVLVHKFVCRGTVEEKIDALIDSKRALSNELFASAGGEVLLTEMSNDELMTLVSLDVSRALGESG